ncbi:phage tail protein [Actinoplanes sp. CA-051413]|uniref:phage tail protein n=1 Tax=Actinoplanes sp. CA-051413 TaxID=3239899 RepID=UPI003D969F30
MTDTDEAVAVCFVVSIDDDNLGSFNSCDGLGCEVVMEQREEGGSNGVIWQLPTRMKYSNVKLSRPVTSASAGILRYFTEMTSGVKRRTATIEARTQEGTVIARWALTGVIPVRWTGPQLSADSPKVATETLELAHHGFLAPGAGA